ncbi:MAG TPA: hypothetical protein VGI96_38975 [Streptosporangiaceae bacterium]|jgi:hypothetical protein
MTLTGRLRVTAAGLAAAGGVLLASGCGNGSAGLASVGSTATASPSSTATASTATAVATASTAPLKLANFPSSQDGDLARTICQAWSGLRGQYYSRVKTDTPGQLSQWLAGADWTAIRADTLQLGSDPDYSHLNAALGTVMAGKAASAKTGQAVDQACTAGN